VRQCAVTPFAVTQGERSSFPLQETRDLPRHTDVTGNGTLETRGDTAVPGDQQRAIDGGRCCGKQGAELRCKLCRYSPTYWQRHDAQTPNGSGVDA
jgi:hypothetical protein